MFHCSTGPAMLHSGCKSAHKSTRPFSCRILRVTTLISPSAAAAQHLTAPAVFDILAGACTTHKAEIGVNSLGYRGLIASENIHAGQAVVSVPLRNVLQVPRKLSSAAAVEAAAAALQRWQQQHGQLPQELSHLVLDPECPWEAKLVAWLLHLRASTAGAGAGATGAGAAGAGTSSSSSLWSAYCQALPSAEETLTFFCYRPEQAEQLQFSTWRLLASSQRQLLLEVQHHCSRCFSSSSSSSSSLPPESDVGWALSMVKSRTFGRALFTPGPTQDCCSNPNSSSSSSSSTAQLDELDPSGTSAAAAAAAARSAAGPAAAAAAAEDADDESNVVLLMVPFVDMINQSPENNCVFGVNWQQDSFEVTAKADIAQGEEVTISYGSNKTNLALLSCYGFFIPGNVNDAQLLQPVFSSCLAAAGGIKGFQKELVDEALLLLPPGAATTMAQGAGASSNGTDDSAQHEQQQQQQQVVNQQALLAAARRRCAVAALPVVSAVCSGEVSAAAAAAAAVPANSKQVTQQLQLQRYLAELMVYQIEQVLRLCTTTAEDDAALLHQLDHGEQDSSSGSSSSGSSSSGSSSSGSSSGSSSSSSSSSAMDRAVLQLATAARLEQKLLLLECRAVCRQLLQVISDHLKSAAAA